MRVLSRLASRARAAARERFHRWRTGGAPVAGSPKNCIAQTLQAVGLAPIALLF